MCFRADLGDVVKIPEPKSIFDFEPEQGGTTKEERVQVRVFFIWGNESACTSFKYNKSSDSSRCSYRCCLSHFLYIT